MHIDLGGIHVGEAALDIMPAARKRPVRHAGDFDHRILVVIRGELEPKLRDLLLQEFYGGVGKDVGVGIDGAISGHCLSPGLARHVLRITRRSMQAMRTQSFKALEG